MIDEEDMLAGDGDDEPSDAPTKAKKKGKMKEKEKAAHHEPMSAEARAFFDAPVVFRPSRRQVELARQETHVETPAEVRARKIQAAAAAASKARKDKKTHG
jgi:hypothetical protein